MKVLEKSWCFCNGGGKSERMKASIFSSKGQALARIGIGGSLFGTGFLIHRNLLLTTHVNLPSVASAESAEIWLQNGVQACLFPHRFFITSSILDLTIVGLDIMDGDSNAQGQHPLYMKTCTKVDLDLGSVVYLLGYAENKELKVGECKVVIATDNLIKLSTDEVIWNPGSVGFDGHGNLAFMVCDPMKLATPPNTKSNTTSSASSSWKKDFRMQFGIPIPVICDWLNQHWEGSLDELTKPKLPLIRLKSAGQKSEFSSASFTMRQVFKSAEIKSAEAEEDGTPSSSNIMSKPNCMPGTSLSPIANIGKVEARVSNPNSSHLQGIPTPEIYESPRLNSIPFSKKASTQNQLLSINFPPRITRPPVSYHNVRKLLPFSDENFVKQVPLQHAMQENHLVERVQSSIADADMASIGSTSEVQSSSFPVEAPEAQNGYNSSEGETTMYSAETAESHNYPSPKQGNFKQVGRSQSCVNYNRWGTVQRNPIAQRTMGDKSRSFVQGRKMYSQGATSQRSNDYYSPTVSSIMKKRNNLEQPSRPKQFAVHSSAKWTF
ncbi:hypothetical protein DCAR_0314358 [Daucus carota subsp. sativus]|uniref:Peptidase S1 domain-containing protein n=1 Tax=Daucus carota subsp. sativus TaxID=79200 RepID=A0A162AP88_DAUCS|nr:PREDICTED: uncharacterized protein LOC108211139 [Daucus carota subsp. sativus]WOG95056.1 hypothetical protein DCAR_0314358 [Daucus carota subsp. sativus]